MLVERDVSNGRHKICIFNRSITIGFDKGDANRSKIQAIVDYLADVKDNAKEYNSALYVAEISVLKLKLQWKTGFSTV